MKITFCDFWDDGAYEFTLSWGGATKSGDHWDLTRDGQWYMGCFIRYNGVWTFTGNSADEINSDFHAEMVARIERAEFLGPQIYESYRNARIRSN